MLATLITLYVGDGDIPRFSFYLPFAIAPAPFSTAHYQSQYAILPSLPTATHLLLPKAMVRMADVPNGLPMYVHVPGPPLAGPSVGVADCVVVGVVAGAVVAGVVAGGALAVSSGGADEPPLFAPPLKARSTIPPENTGAVNASPITATRAIKQICLHTFFIHDSLFVSICINRQAGYFRKYDAKIAEMHKIGHIRQNILA